MPKGNSATKGKDKEKHIPSIKKQQQEASRREAAAAKRMQDLIRQFGSILRQVSSCHLFLKLVVTCCGCGICHLGAPMHSFSICLGMIFCLF